MSTTTKCDLTCRDLVSQLARLSPNARVLMADNVADPKVAQLTQGGETVVLIYDDSKYLRWCIEEMGWEDTTEAGSRHGYRKWFDENY